MKMDKVGEVFCVHCYQDCEYETNKNCLVCNSLRHALLEVIKAELPKEKELDYSSDSFISCNTNALMGYNQALTEVNAILERLFLGEEK